MATNKATTLCCQCNGVNAKCKRCLCVKMKRPCLNCLPLRSNNCQNTLGHRQEKLVRQSLTSSTSDRPLANTPVPNSISTNTNTLANSVSLDTRPADGDCRYDSAMIRAFGVSLTNSGLEQSTLCDDVWRKRWETVVHLRGRLYSLPGGSVGRKYACLRK